MSSKIESAVEVLLELSCGSEEDYDRFRVAVAKLLSGVDRTKPYKTPLFDAFARLGWTIAFEAVVIRINEANGQPEVFLRHRSADDTAYPNEWHAPGSAFRPSERPRDVADRLANEFGAKIAFFEQVGHLFTDEERGSFLSLIYLVVLEGNPQEDDRHHWYPVAALPRPTVVAHEKHIIPIAVQNFFSARVR